MSKKIEEKQEIAEGEFTEVKETEVKTNFIDKAYGKYCERRKHRAEKKANKKELTKAEKGMRIGAGVAVGGALIGAAVKTYLRSVQERCAEDGDQDDTLYSEDSEEMNDSLELE